LFGGSFNSKVPSQVSTRTPTRFIAPPPKIDVARLKKGSGSKLKFGTFSDRVKGVIKREKRLRTSQENVYKSLGISANFELRKDLKKYGTLVQRGSTYGVEFVKAAARLPFEVAGLPLVIGGRAALAVEASFKSEGRKELLKAIPETGSAIVKAYDPRNPEGLLNIALTAVAIKGLAKSRAAQIKFNKELSKSQASVAKVKVTQQKGNTVKIEMQGKLKVGKETHPFYKKTIQKTQPNGKFKATTKVSFKVKNPNKTFQNILKKVSRRNFKPGTKTATLKSKGTQITTQKAFAQAKGGKVSTITKGTIKGRGVNAKFKTIAKGNKASTILKQKKTITAIKSQINNIKNPTKSVQTFNVKQIQQTSTIKGLIKSFKKSKLQAAKAVKSKGVSSSGKVILRKNIKVANTMISRLGKQLKSMGKKGQTTIGRSADGKLGTDFRPKLSGRDTSAADLILKNLNKKLRAAAKTRQSLKSSARARAVVKAAVRPKAISPSALETLIPGARAALLPRIITIIPFLPNLSEAVIKGETSPKVINKALAKDIVIDDVIIQDVTKPVDVVEPVQDVNPRSSTRITSTTSVINNVFTGVPAVFAASGFIPLAGGFFGTPGAKSTQRGFRFPTGVLASKFFYSSDLYSRLFGGSVSLAEGKKLLTPGRIFTGLETRKVIRNK